MFIQNSLATLGHTFSRWIEGDPAPKAVISTDTYDASINIPTEIVSKAILDVSNGEINPSFLVF
jgi:hypothetical protein